MSTGDEAMRAGPMECRAAWVDDLPDETFIRMVDGFDTLRAFHPDGFVAVATRSGRHWMVSVYDRTRCLERECCYDAATLIVCLRESFLPSWGEGLCGDGRWRPLGAFLGALR